MSLRIRLRLTPPLAPRYLALATATLLAPAAVSAMALSCWRLSADLRWTRAFFVSDGLWSHWQVWFGLAVLLETVVILLNRFGRGARQTARALKTQRLNQL